MLLKRSCAQTHSLAPAINESRRIFSDETDVYLMQEPIVEAHSQAQIEFDPVRWAQLNPWLAEGQADDRIPMNGSVKDSGGPPSVQRSFARRSHQAMFKKWSQARRD
jgi:type II secretory pathway component PulM